MTLLGLDVVVQGMSTARILHDLLGYSAADVQRLATAGVLGEAPA